MKKIIGLSIFFVFMFVGLVCAAAIEDTLHIGITVWDSSNNLQPNTAFTFKFDISNESDCNPILYTNTSVLTTNRFSKVSSYLENINFTSVNQQHYLCYYRDGVLQNVSRILRPVVKVYDNLTVTDTFTSTNITTNNLTVDDIRSKTGNITFYNNTGQSRMSILSNGNVGIGTTAPGYKLEVNGIIYATGGGINTDYNLYAGGTGSFAGEVNTNVITPYTAGATIIFKNESYGGELMRFTGTGRLGIGTNSPTAKLDVNGNLTAGGSNTLVVQSGVVGINKQDPAVTLDMQGSYMRFNASTATSAAYLNFINGGGNAYFGVDNSVGNGLMGTGGMPYGLAFGTANANPFIIFTNNIARLKIGSGGETNITGNHFVDGSTNIGNAGLLSLAKFSVESAGGSRTALFGDGTAYVEITDDGLGMYSSARPLNLWVDQTVGRGIVIESGGNVTTTNNLFVNGSLGIGTIYPTAGLHINTTPYGLYASPVSMTTDISGWFQSYITISTNPGTNYPMVISGYGNTATGPSISMIKTRSATTNDANTVVVNGDTLFSLEGHGADGTTYRRAGQIKIEVDGAPGASDMPGRIVFYTTRDGNATVEERMRITNAGRVGIGTDAPSSNLTVIGDLNVTGTSYLGNITINTDNITTDNIFSKTGNITFYNNTGQATFTVGKDGKLRTQNMLIKEESATSYSIRSSADNAYRSLTLASMDSGNLYWQLNDNGIYIRGDSSSPGLYWSTTSSYAGAKDVGITRKATSELMITNGTSTGFGDLVLNRLNVTNGTYISGNVGIGTNAPAQKLVVNGDVNITGSVTISGNFSAKRAYGMFSSNKTEIITVANTPTAINWSHTEDSYLISLVGNQNISIQDSGDYLIELSAIAGTDSPSRHIEIWPQINGVNVIRSNTKVEIPTAAIEVVISVPFILDLNQGDHFRIMMASDDPGTELTYTTNTSYSPETPSIIMTISKISESSS